jgi:hypothetical protein
MIDEDEVSSYESDLEVLQDEDLDYSEKYTFILDKYIKLFRKYKDLKLEYSENTVIQSMNDMKERYEQLQRETVSLYRFNELQQKYKKQSKVINAVLVILENTSKRLRNLDSFLHTDRQKEVYRCEIELLIINELLEEFEK